MLTELTRVLAAWAEDSSISLVLLTGRGERAFCAGGDIADFHRAITTGRHQEFIDLLAMEFDLDYLISSYPKPLISLAHGITMGGGVGLASHAPVRLATSSATMGMPEAKIGYTPDVGGTHLLANAPGHFGEYLAMSAASFTGADAVYLGFADVVVTDSFAENILDELDELVGLSAAEIISAIEVLHGAPEFHALELSQGWVDHAFSADSPQEVLERLEQMVHPAATAGGPIALGQLALQRELGVLHGAPGARRARPPLGAGEGIAHGPPSDASARSCRGHPCPGDRQGPQPALVACPHERSRSPRITVAGRRPAGLAIGAGLAFGTGDISMHRADLGRILGLDAWCADRILGLAHRGRFDADTLGHFKVQWRVLAEVVGIGFLPILLPRSWGVLQ
ncbi:enoyl-CoA hydratase/isomerase family protein [Glutamicibacter halophytocola]|uniref:enoyl-CoA hydratase/isomerase family protein n=1 Tax=Glutamicibacter halophytocola TaxID=1933880 RepID=UPI003D2738AA